MKLSLLITAVLFAAALWAPYVELMVVMLGSLAVSICFNIMSYFDCVMEKNHGSNGNR